MTPEDHLVAPDAVRVWRGFRSPDLSLDDFYAKLGTVFVPATVKMQTAAGLHSYTPTVPAGLSGKPDTTPDETAILFWRSQATYWNGFDRLAVRAYTLTHNGVYVMKDKASRADFPTRFEGELTPDAPVFLFDKPADWMRGAIRHLIAARPPDVTPAKFQASIASALVGVQKGVKLDGAIACVGADYLVYWELTPAAVGAAQRPSGIPLLQPHAGWSQIFSPAPTFLPVGLWDEWAGMDVRAGSSFNMVFERGDAP